MLKIVLSFSTIVILAVLTSQPSFAQTEKMNQKNGLQLSQRLCSNCHIVDNNKDAIANERAPAFSKIASYPGQTPERLAGKIIIPHPEMPKISLTRKEIKDIISYITSLKKPE